MGKCSVATRLMYLWTSYDPPIGFQDLPTCLPICAFGQFASARSETAWVGVLHCPTCFMHLDRWDKSCVVVVVGGEIRSSYLTFQRDCELRLM